MVFRGFLFTATTIISYTTDLTQAFQFPSRIPITLQQRPCSKLKTSLNSLLDHEGETLPASNDNTSKGTMSRLSFLSHSVSTALAVSAIASFPSECLAYEGKAAAVSNLQSSLLSSSAKMSAETLQETISGFVSGAALSTTKTFVKYPLDTATVRLQMPNTEFSISNLVELFDGSYRGISLPLVSNIPGGAVFFAVKDATKNVCKEAGMPKWMATCIAVGVANFPYWLIRNPSEVIKTRQQANIEGYVTTGNDLEGKVENISALSALKLALNKTESGGGGLSELYTGYWENIIYAYPADVIKFLAYDKLSKGKKNVSASEGAVYGAAATACAQFFTTPLDVVRNRIMAGKDKDQDTDIGYFSRFVRIARDEGTSGLFAGASPRVGKAFLSGAIQFATYEETKKSVGALLRPKL
jgi:solute carrier family 25 S-adenosylmethionine transporter 26